ncbi:hypothetical protein BY996DRAFT_4575473 [Phakopsora pachyrhizi]|nr:hypothetical protein BY996DRAFT_4575473 [Phakopsora pachyrhizi]
MRHHLPKEHLGRKHSFILEASQTAIICQLHTGHIGLSAFLHHFKKLPSPRCRCGATETPLHFLLYCTLYRPQWQQMQ